MENGILDLPGAAPSSGEVAWAGPPREPEYNASHSTPLTALSIRYCTAGGRFSFGTVSSGREFKDLLGRLSDAFVHCIWVPVPRSTLQRVSFPLFRCAVP